eukprot:CAMPEP_0171926046 /NCGR_PEP_ID=MMETSP0993-20121228/24596_1 /TAXON_ID=483369 /ORGANISM="non described non described, Strain CCMP2098" /LENGTH=472 /DNA_ID=CAMNT_0012564823 /DNA_START=32 /DNA_END=1450 /DNA_ORIENTATION=+
MPPKRKCRAQETLQETENGPTKKIAAGAEFMIFQNSAGESCDSSTVNRKADSRVHLYHRTIGFARCAQDQADVRDFPNVIGKALNAHRETGATDKASQDQITERWSLFERWMLCTLPTHKYSLWLGNLGDQCDGQAAAVAVAFQAPPTAVIEAYIYYLREDGKKGGTIRVYIGGLTSTCTQFQSKEKPTQDGIIRTLIGKYETLDGHEETPSFDFLTDLPNIHAQCWGMKGWAEDKILLVWTMFLIAICLMARCSEVTEFCPLYEDIRLPAEHLWDSDGYPKWIELALRDWKHRSQKNKGKPYYIRVHRNTLDPRFDPVFYLLRWLSYSGIEEGPIFQPLKPMKSRGASGCKCTGEKIHESAWEKMTTRLFVKAGLYVAKVINPDGSSTPGHGCTNHAIRKSTVQWAGRCNGHILDVKNNGRWKDLKDVAHYHGQGAAEKGRQTEGGNRDPVLRVWMWKKTAVAGFDGKDQL